MTRDLSKGLNEESEKVGARIGNAFSKLAKKMRRRADKAKAAMVKTKSRSKAIILQRRCEMYTNAAHDIDQALAERKAGAVSKDNAPGNSPPARVVP